MILETKNHDTESRRTPDLNRSMEILRRSISKLNDLTALDESKSFFDRIECKKRLYSLDEENRSGLSGRKFSNVLNSLEAMSKEELLTNYESSTKFNFPNYHYDLRRRMTVLGFETSQEESKLIEPSTNSLGDCQTNSSELNSFHSCKSNLSFDGHSNLDNGSVKASSVDSHPESRTEPKTNQSRRKEDQNFRTRDQSQFKKRRRSTIQSCVFPEGSLENMYTPTKTNKTTLSSSNLVTASARVQLTSESHSNTSDSVGVRFRRISTSVGRDLRKSFRRFSVFLSPKESTASLSETRVTVRGENNLSRALSEGYRYEEEDRVTRSRRPVTFPWRREQLGYNETNSHRHHADSLKEEGKNLEDDPTIALECFPEDIYRQFPSAKCQTPSMENVLESKPRRNSSFSRSSISHSEWDIRRPWSTADADSSTLSQSTCRLAASNQVSEDLQARHDEALSIPYQNNSGVGYQNSHEGMFQKFKKSLSLRLNKKSSRSESPAGVDKSLSSLPMEVPLTSDDFQTSLVTSPRSSGKDDDSKSNYFKFGHPIFRSSKERRKAKLKDIRSSKCNSGDSGDSGIEVISGTSTLVGGELTPSLICREDSSPQIINYLGNNNVTSEETRENDNNNMGVRRTQSDMSGKHPTKHSSCSDFVHRQSLGRQYSSPQPIKLRPHHRLPNYNSVTAVQVQRNQRLRRSRASTHLRRSVSQPLDLDKSFQAQVSLHKMRTTDDDPSTERLRRPSVDNLLSEENTSEEEGGMSDCEEFKPDFKFYMEEEEEMIVYAEALWDHVSLDSDELVFKAGDLITVVDSSDRDWWWGRIPPRSGWFPASFVRLLVNQEDHLTKSDDADDPGIWNDRQLSISSLSQDEIRSNVINEILSTERDYVKHLKDVVEGYLKQVRKRPDMFNEESISTIFGNMEALFSFHTEFLTQLELCMDFKEPHLSCIGDCFISNKSRFEIYSEYCNNHPLAVYELQQLYQYQKYVHFFEACRLLQEMIDISLDGFLLTPVQKICKYPLQLQELLKYTQPYHKDYSTVHGAMQAMKEVALLVNERRRRVECLEKIATWQKSVEGWEGPDLLEDSSQLIHQGEVTKGANTSWPKEVSLFLFDHQLIYCKKDLLKRNTFVYRGRINTDLCEVFAIPFDPTRSAALQNAWKIHCLHKNKTYVFSCKTPAEKIKWLNAFKKERELVAVDEESGFVASERQKQVARLAARNQKSKPKKPKTVKSHKRTQVMTYAQAHLLVNDGEIRSNSLPLRGTQESKKKGLWFNFGGHKKSRGSKQNSILND